MAERMREAVETARFETPAGARRVTLSLGVAEYDRRMSSPKELVAAADRALYAAKRAGRNRVVDLRGQGRGQVAPAAHAQSEFGSRRRRHSASRSAIADSAPSRVGS